MKSQVSVIVDSENAAKTLLAIQDLLKTQGIQCYEYGYMRTDQPMVIESERVRGIFRGVV